MKNIKLNMNNIKDYIKKGEDVYYTKILNKAIIKIKEGKSIFYNEEEFWKIVQEEN